jgi:DNA replication protein DnaC
MANMGDGLLLRGGPGTGKTHLAAAIIRHQIEHGLKCSFFPVAKLYSDLREAFRLNASAVDIVKPCMQSPLIVLDDLGAGALTDFERRSALEVIEARLNSLRPTIVTTNLDLEDIAAKLDDRIASRVASYTNIELGGVDRRLSRRRGRP